MKNTIERKNKSINEMILVDIFKKYSIQFNHNKREKTETNLITAFYT